MSLTLEQLREEALTLPFDQRLDLADTLYSSVGPQGPSDTEEFGLHPDWEAELDRRSAEITNGTAVMHSHEEVFYRMDEILGGR